MSSEIAVTATAQRTLGRLPPKAAIAIVEFVYGTLAESPHRVGKPLRFELEGQHSARRAEYRVLSRIDDDQHIVTVDVIAHRSDSYRRR
jgi:mRNA-degrading endonuclease RelE of RelBE toxin-antitoxin system